MPRYEGIDLSHLSGGEVERVATALVSGNVKAIIERREDLISLKPDEMQKLIDFSVASRANCGGFGCG